MLWRVLNPSPAFLTVPLPPRGVSCFWSLQNVTSTVHKIFTLTRYTTSVSYTHLCWLLSIVCGFLKLTIVCWTTVNLESCWIRMFQFSETVAKVEVIQELIVFNYLFHCLKTTITAIKFTKLNRFLYIFLLLFNHVCHFYDKYNRQEIEKTTESDTM